MKRMMKRSFAILLSLMMVVAMTACGSEEKKSEKLRTPELLKSITKKTGLHMDFSIEQDKDGDIDMDMYCKKDDLYIDYEEGDEHLIIISDGDLITVLDPATKTGQQAGLDDSTRKQLDDMQEDLDTIYDLDDDDLDWKTGTVKQDGMEYDSEEVKNDDQTTKFLYNDDDELVYIISKKDKEEKVIKIKAFDNDVPKDAFEIPDDYNITGSDSNPEPTPKTDTGSSTKQPTGSYKTFTDETHGFQFEVDNAFGTKIDGESMYVYTGNDGQVPMIRHFIMQNSSGQTDEQLLSAVGNDIVKKEGNNLVKGPITNTFNAGSRQIKGLEWITKSEDGSKNKVTLQYVEQIQTFFHIWTIVYYEGDTVTPAAAEHAIQTFQMLAG